MNFLKITIVINVSDHVFIYNLLFSLIVFLFARVRRHFQLKFRILYFIGYYLNKN